MERVGIFLFNCLPHTETFIYDSFNNLYNFEPHILAKVFRKNNQFNFNKHIVRRQYASSFFIDTPLYYLKARFFQNRLLRLILNVRDPFSEYIRKNKIRLLHAHFALDGLYALSLSNKCDIPLVVSLHGGYDTDAVLNIKGFPKNEFFQKVNLFTVASAHSKENLLFNGCPNEKIRVLYYGVQKMTMPERETRREITRDGHSVKLLLVGRMTEKKGILDAVCAFSKLKKKYKNITLTIITGERRQGSAILKEKLKGMGFTFYFNTQLGYEKKVLRYIAYVNCARQISIIGALPHERVRQMMKEHDIFILPSRTAPDGDAEGMPLVLLEAQAAGIPVVTTLHAGNSEAIVNQRTGYVVREGDIEGMANRLGALINDTELRISMGAEGKKHIESHFSMGRHIENLEAIYTQLLNP